MIKKGFFYLLALLIACPLAAQAQNVPKGAAILMKCYPDFVKGYKDGKLIMSDGSTLVYDDGRQKSFVEKLDDADPEEDQKAVMQAEEDREHDASTNPEDIPLATDGEGEQTETMDEVNNGEGEATVDENGQIAPPNKEGAEGQDKLSKVLGVLLKLSDSLG
jgi:hypothetical protein